MRALLLAVGAVALLIVGAAAATLVISVTSTDDEAESAEVPVTQTATATVTQRTMQVTEEFDGTLGYTGDGVILAGKGGTYTKLPAEGDILTLGDAIYEVNGSDRSYVMDGTRPAWRALSTQSDAGADIKQLERSLRALGHLKDGVDPDRQFTGATKNAVKRWERATNQDDDGRIGVGDVTFLDGDVRIVEVVPELGSRATPGSVLARTSSTDLVVTVDLEADRRDLVAVGDAVTVEMPDEAVVAGTITEIDTVATTLPGASEATVGVTIELDDEAATGDLDGAAVTVSVVRQTRPDVLSVPVDSLLALREGGYALELVEGDGSTYLTAVEVGLFDDDGVQVRGDIRVGDTVVVPA